MKTSSEQPGTRQRLIGATLDLLQRVGLHGFGLSDVLAAAQAPKGVLYHHFPGGKVELAIAAIQTATSQIAAGLEQLRATAPDPVQALRLWLGQAQKRLEKSGFERGCPLAAVALESTAADTALREALDEAFAALRLQIAHLLIDAGIDEKQAARLATLAISAYEGALIQSRISGDAAPMNETAELLLQLVETQRPK